MTTAEERKARREERLMKEEKRRMFLMGVWTMIRFFLAGAAMSAVAMWLAVVMWDNVEWALTVSWWVTCIAVGSALFKMAAK